MYLFGELLKSLFVKNFMVSIRLVKLLDYSLELNAVRRAILLFDIVKKFFHIVQFNVAKEIQQKGVNSHHTGVDNILVIL